MDLQPQITIVFSFFNVLNLLSGIDQVLIPAADFFKFVNEQYQSNNSFQVREILIDRLSQLKKEETQILDRLDVENHAIQSLKTELEKLESSVAKLREERRSNHISKKCAEAALSYISEHLSETQIANIIAPPVAVKSNDTSSSQSPEDANGESPSADQMSPVDAFDEKPSNSKPQNIPARKSPLHETHIAESQPSSPLSTNMGSHSADSTTNQSSSEKDRFTSFLWFLTSGTKTPHTEQATKEALNEFFRFLFSLSDEDLIHIISEHEPSVQDIVQEIMKQLLKIRPDFQGLYLQIMAELLRSPFVIDLLISPPPQESNSASPSPSPIESIIYTMRSINDDVNREASNCIIKLAQTANNKVLLGQYGAAAALVDLLWRSQSEAVLEASVTALWHLAIADENKALIRECGGIEAVCSLLKSPYDGVLENSTIALGYLTRDDENKAKLRECDGLKLLIEVLLYPKESIQSKAAGALWNCASNSENKSVIRKLGGIDALITLLDSDDEHALENATGALWNCAVNTENKKEILRKDGIPKLIHLLDSVDNMAIIENVSGTLWNCATVGEIKVLLRKIDGLKPLLNLLYCPNQHIQENAAGAIRNCAINDQNKVALRKLGGIKIFTDILSTSQQRVSILEKITSTLWICSIDQENKLAIRENGTLPILIELLSHKSLSVVEKALGTLRNCSTIPENKVDIQKCGGIAHFIRLLSPEFPPSLNEYAAATLWNLARNDENKVMIRKQGGIVALIESLRATEEESDASFEAIQENVAGALLTLTLDADNRNAVRTAGGLKHVVRLLESNNEYVLENAISALKNCAANDTNIVHLKDTIPRLITLLESKNDNIIRESALCLKNLSLDATNARQITEQKGVEILLRHVTSTKNENLRKILVYTIQSIMR